jgi:hypothetical protein
MFKEIIIEIFSTEMGISGYCFNGKDTVGDSKEGNIEGSTTEIENENILLFG